MMNIPRRLRSLAAALSFTSLGWAAGGAGRDWGVERTSYIDPESGLRIHDLTRPDGAALNLYYHFSNFTADNRNVILAVTRGGSTQIFRSEVATGRLVQLTDSSGVAAAGACPHPKNPDLLYYLRGPDVWELNIRLLAERRVGTIPEPRVMAYGQPTFSHDLRSLTVSKRRDERNWEIGLIDVATGEYRTVVTQGFLIGHVQHSPVEPLIFYVWETGGYAPQRSWVVSSDGSANRPFYFRTDPKTWFTPLKEWMTHEAWVAETGEMTMIMDKVGIVVVDRAGESRMVEWGNYWHVAARPDGKFLVADDFDGRVWLIQRATGNRRLLASGVRGAARKTHAHASFDREGRWVLFNNSRNHDTVSIVEVPR